MIYKELRFNQQAPDPAQLEPNFFIFTIFGNATKWKTWFYCKTVKRLSVFTGNETSIFHNQSNVIKSSNHCHTSSIQYNGSKLPISEVMINIRVCTLYC